MTACPDNSQENFAWRKSLVGDMARYTILISNPLPTNYTKEYSFFAFSWKYFQVIDLSHTSELHLLFTELPARFHATIKRYIDSEEAILSLPMVLLHQDFGDSNIMADETTCHLASVIGWAEAELGPFGLNLSTIESISGKLHLRNGWSRYADYNNL